MTDSRSFPLADVLSVTTGLMLTRRTPHPGAALDEILTFMTGETLAWWQAPRAADACTEALHAQHPFLADLLPPEGTSRTPLGKAARKAALQLWLFTAELKHGTVLEIEPLTDWVHQDQGKELLDQIELAALRVEPS
ncbi:hypothetical protein ACIGMX_34565 [Streptomyces aquilus]|uniref:DUF7736 domain-containing protein n=1 Tax=Streptomyces aquilus TaxID=2548456 RepID=UPI0037D88A35